MNPYRTPSEQAYYHIQTEPKDWKAEVAYMPDGTIWTPWFATLWGNVVTALRPQPFSV